MGLQKEERPRDLPRRSWELGRPPRASIQRSPPAACLTDIANQLWRSFRLNSQGVLEPPLICCHLGLRCADSRECR